MKPSGKSKADLQFRRKRSLTASAKTSGAVGQTGMPVFLAFRLLGSGKGHRFFDSEWHNSEPQMTVTNLRRPSPD
jgi:hypothetical protein